LSHASIYRAAPSHAPPRDVYAGVWGMGDRAVSAGAALGITVALLLHGMGVVRAAMSLSDMLEWLRGSRREIATFYYQTYEVDLREEEKPEVKKEEEKPPEPEPEPEPEPPPKPDAPPPEKVEDPYKEAPPPPAAAAQELLTAKAEEPLDFSDEGFVTGKGPGGIGYVAADGTAKEARNPKGRPDGTKGGTGNTPGAPVQAPAGVDLSKPATLAGSRNWNCPFPPEADAAQMDSASATVIVTVRPDGTPQSVSVTSDPGYGFGRAARTCALGRKYQAPLDREGKPTTGVTPPLRVKFTR
jgi:protein TonB